MMTTAAAGPTVELTAEFKNLNGTKGTLLLAIYNSESSFIQDGKEFRTAATPSKKGVYTFKNLPAGEYALAIFQDENDNGELDKNWVGIPTERYGFSNNVMGSVGPPSFHDAKVVVNKSKKISIVLR
jgi:uncharacterized protein (DUF2141 family)